MEKMRKGLLGFLIGIFVLSLCSCKTKISDKKLNIHLINVGQAEAIFIELPNQETILVDGGNSGSNDNSCSSDKTINCFNDALRVASYILELGYNQVSYYIATHPHEDHLGAMPDIFQYLQFKKAYIPFVSSTGSILSSFLRTIKSRQIPLFPINSGTILVEDQELKLKVEFLGPDCQTPSTATYSESSFSPSCSVYQTDPINAHSAIFMVTFGKEKALFTGDASANGAARVLEKYGDELKADVYKAMHHGSTFQNSNSSEFLKKVQPEYILVSCGNGNTYNHPSPALIVNAWEAGVDRDRIYDTSSGGQDVNKEVESIICIASQNKVTCDYKLRKSQ